MRIAIEGCLHGELDILYNTVKFIEQQHQTKIDLLIVCGDFQAVRNEGKLSMRFYLIINHYSKIDTVYMYNNAPATCLILLQKVYRLYAIILESSRVDDRYLSVIYKTAVLG